MAKPITPPAPNQEADRPAAWERMNGVVKSQTRYMHHPWGAPETLFMIWTGIALVSLVAATVFLRGAFPLLTVVWLIVPVLAVTRGRNGQRVGFRRISPRLFASTTTANLILLLLISVLVEPWSQTYQALVQGALAGTPPDTTFAWFVRYDGWKAWTGFLFYAGLVTLYAEELFFRGWLLGFLQVHLKPAWSILAQAVLFTLPQLIASILLSPFQGFVYAAAYSWLGVGVVGGWAAWRTRSIWPSLVAATLWNAILIAWVL